MYPSKVRYFLVGEYGSLTQRPHYHVAIFGLDPIVGGGLNGEHGLVHDTWCKKDCKTTRKVLDKECRGFTFTGDLSKESAGYICGYVTKKMTKKDDLRLLGRPPEFARMSLRPGIGATAMMDVAGALSEYVTPEMFQNGQFPSVLAHGKKKLPLGRYLRSVLRQELGYSRKTSEDEKMAFIQKLRLMQKTEQETAKAEKRAIDYYYKMRQQVKNIESRYKIYDKKGTL